MNRAKYGGLFYRLAYRLMLSTRWVGTKRVCKSFGRRADQRPSIIQQICVINLDRQVHRWSRIQRELEMILDRSKCPLIELTKRFSAIDARYFAEPLNHAEIQPSYLLADQLFVEPNPLLSNEYANDNQPVDLTRQEIAVALSHISIWKQIASGDNDYTLILEDDIFFCRDFVRVMDKIWVELTYSLEPATAFDVLYVSYDEAKTKMEKEKVSELLFKPIRGLWFLSGYVLSKKGAKNLLELLPVRGPVDLWINHQFDKLDVYATRKPIVNQRRDFRSDNLYSIMPVLSRVGVFTDEKPSIFKTKKLPKPIFALGEQGTGLTSLAMALSMLGYRCCSDMTELPKNEHDNLLSKKKNRVFDAYVNIGSLSDLYIGLAKAYPEAKFIITIDDDEKPIELNQVLSDEKMGVESPLSERVNNACSISALFHNLSQISQNVLVLPRKEKNKWAMLCEFLECDPPNGEYPTFVDQKQRQLSIESLGQNETPIYSKMKFDPSPWIISSRRDWHGFSFDNVNLFDDDSTITISENFRTLDTSTWKLLNDTFPSNLALFDPKNFSIANDNIAKLTLQKECSGVREYKSASICSRKNYLYGRFTTVIKPVNIPGVIAGVFLHRNSPRQEIDIEFLGKDTTKILVNVFYNPGGEGARFDYGYRGTPALIDLGFDASKEFHQYSIEWSPISIHWIVDGRLVYKRANWNPTPIPHLPMQFYINLWPSRSEELAGRLCDRNLPVCSEIRSINMKIWPDN